MVHRKNTILKTGAMYLCLSLCAPLLEELKIVDSLSKLSIITQLPQNRLQEDNIFNLLCGWQICIVTCKATVTFWPCNAALPAQIFILFLSDDMGIKTSLGTRV